MRFGVEGGNDRKAEMERKSREECFWSVGSPTLGFARAVLHHDSREAGKIGRRQPRRTGGEAPPLRKSRLG